MGITGQIGALVSDVAVCVVGCAGFVVFVGEVGRIDKVGGVGVCTWVDTIEDSWSVSKTSNYWEIMGCLWLFCISQFNLLSVGNEVGFK